MTTTEERAAFLHPWVTIAATITDPDQREVYLRSGLVTRQIEESDVPDPVRAQLLHTASVLPVCARAELGDWTRAAISAHDRIPDDEPPNHLPELVDARHGVEPHSGVPVVVFVLSNGGEYLILPHRVGIFMEQLRVPWTSPLRSKVYGIARILHGSDW